MVPDWSPSSHCAYSSAASESLREFLPPTPVLDLPVVLTLLSAIWRSAEATPKEPILLLPPFPALLATGWPENP
jgi:hypothetical protein